MARPLSSALYPTPTTSISCVNPFETPVTAFATKARAVPCMAVYSSPWRSAVNLPSSSLKLTLHCRGIGTASFPFGPSIATSDSLTFTLTSFGISITFFPTRDITFMVVGGWRLVVGASFGRAPTTNDQLLINATQHLAADVGLTRLFAGHHAARSAHDVDAQTAQHLRDLSARNVDAAARKRNALKARNHALSIRPVAQKDAQRPSVAALGGLDAVIGYVSFLFEDARNFDLQARRRHIHLGVTRADRVPHARQHV